MQINQLENPKQTWFFERFDGSIIAVQEYEAWNLVCGRSKALGPVRAKPKIIGVSDGTKNYQAVSEAHQLFSEGKVEEAKERVRQGFNEELESARGHIIQPRNMDEIKL